MNITKNVRNFCYGLYDLRKLDREGRNPDGPVVSLTSVPRRIQLIKPTIVSLLKQKLKPKKIEINLGEDLFRGYNIPDFLHGMESVEVHWQQQDCGPATKLIATLERYRGSSEMIVVVDDDMYYSDELLGSLVRCDREAGGKRVFCINGFLLPRDLRAESVGSDKALRSGCRKVAIIEGCGGYIMRSDHLDHTILLDRTGAPDRALYDDDVWISGHLSRVGIEKFQIPTGKRKSLLNTRESAIGGNRAQLQTDLMCHFTDDWKRDEYET
ncbi:MAG TPA: hypothetical protein HPP76_04980 [Desulfuromonadales bacterium]|nr:hypothetical protein [Desulfuromonadales bacterium]